MTGLSTSAAGEISKGRDAASILLERPGSSACRQPAVVVVDVGATFGSRSHVQQ